MSGVACAQSLVFGGSGKTISRVFTSDAQAAVDSNKFDYSPREPKHTWCVVLSRCPRGDGRSCPESTQSSCLFSTMPSQDLVLRKSRRRLWKPDSSARNRFCPLPLPDKNGVPSSRIFGFSGSKALWRIVDEDGAGRVEVEGWSPILFSPAWLLRID